MTPTVTTATGSLNGNPELNDWAEGSHSEDRMPQYNLTNVASSQEADQAAAIGDDLLPDMRLDIQYTGNYPQSVHFELDEADESFIVVGRAPSFEAVMANETPGDPLERIENHTELEDALQLPELTAAHYAGQNGSVQRQDIQDWISELPAWWNAAAARNQLEMLPLSDYNETIVDHDDSD